VATATAIFVHIDFQVSHGGNFLTTSIALNEHSLPLVLVKKETVYQSTMYMKF